MNGFDGVKSWFESYCRSLSSPLGTIFPQSVHGHPVPFGGTSTWPSSSKAQVAKLVSTRAAIR